MVESVSFSVPPTDLPKRKNTTSPGQKKSKLSHILSQHKNMRMKLYLCLLHTQGSSGHEYIDIFLIIIFAPRHFAWMEQDLNFRSIIKSQPKRQQGNVIEHQFHCCFFTNIHPLN